jgi:hypothetical protein
MKRRITDRDRFIYEAFIENDRRYKSTVALLRNTYPSIGMSEVRRVVAKVENLKEKS